MALSDFCPLFWGPPLRTPFWDSPTRRPPGVGGGGGWHKALVVGSVSLWRRLLASRP